MALTENTVPSKSEKKSQESGVRSNDKDRREKPLSKVIIRRLPPGIKQEDFITQVSPIPDYDYIYTVKGDLSLGENSFSRVYINFCSIEDLYIFKEKFDNYVFVDARGHEYPAVVEYSSFQKVPKRRKARSDPKIGSIESDPLYSEFLESLKEQPNQEEKPEYSYQPSSENKNDRTTPLLDYLKQRKVDRLRIREEKREERRKKEIDRKKYREDDRKKYRDDDRRKYREDDDRRKYRGDDERKKYRDDDDYKKYRDDDHKKYREDDDRKKYRENDHKKYIDEKSSPKSHVSKSGTNSMKDKEPKANDGEEDIVNNEVNNIEDTESKNKEDNVEDLIDKEEEKPYFKNNRVKKYEDKKPINIKPKSKYSLRTDKYDDKKDYKSRREDYHKSKYEENKKNETKEYPKKVKKYSERREERKIEAKKAEQKNDEIHEDKKKLENDVQENKAEETVEFIEHMSEKKTSKSSEERYDDGDSESKNRNKENDPRMQRRIRNKDRPTMAIYKPGMLRKKSVDNDPKDFKDDTEKETYSAKDDE